MHNPAELWKDLPPEEKPLLPPAIQQIILFIIGIIAILGMVTFIFGTFPIGDIQQGKTQSTLLQENMLILPEFSIIFENNTAQALEELYLEEQREEFSVCLQGTFENNIYSIHSLYQPFTYRRAFNRVAFESCDASTLIMLHSHPYKRCTASPTDLDTLKKSQGQNPLMLLVVMCEPQRYAVYR